MERLLGGRELSLPLPDLSFGEAQPERRCRSSLPAAADAYAHWSGKSLPESQQWEKAARGTRGEAYPWGNQQTPAKCNSREGGIGCTTPVDRYHSGVSPYGVYDLCGNVWEWCATERTPAATS